MQFFNNTLIHLKYLLIVHALFLVGSVAQSAEKATAGWIEEAVIYPHEFKIRAKLDTGAKTTSLNAGDAEYFERDGEEWARIRITNKNSITATIEAPVVRCAKIKRHFGLHQKRRVILLDICVGNVRKTEEVNLVDRTGMNYQLLIGRNFLENSLLIDSAETYMLSPACPR